MLADGFSLESEWQQVLSGLQQVLSGLRILAILSNAVIWIVSSNSSRPFNNPLVIVPKAPITIGTIVTFMFHSFFNSLARSHSFRFILWYAGAAKSTISQILFFVVDYYKVWSSGRDKCIIIIMYSWRVFHISVSWWSFTWVWVTASLLKSPGFQ